jgi:fructokinase
MPHCIGIDLGGTKTEIAVLDPQGRLVWRHREPTPAHDYTAILQLMAMLVRQAVAQVGLPWPERLGCGIPGTLDPVSQCVRGANTQVLNGQPLARDLSALLGLQAHVQNDANCLAMSEAVDGAGAGAAMVFAVIIGTGCGGGLALHQRVHTGRNALAGEWGHNPLPWPSVAELQAPACWCGMQGCLETWVSGPGWSREHQRETGELLTPPQIWAAMSRGETQARLSVDRWIDRLARGLAQVVNLLDPDQVVLGGGLSNLPGVAERLEQAIPRYAFHRGSHTPVRVALHGDSSGVRGAAWLARDDAGWTVDESLPGTT